MSHGEDFRLGLSLSNMKGRLAMCRINQIAQLYHSSLRNYAEWRIIDEGSKRGFKIVDDSEFMG
jgi:hypothetical protein